MNSSSMPGSWSRHWKACSCRGLLHFLLIGLFLPLQLSGRTVFVDLSIREQTCTSYDPVSRDCGAGQSYCYQSLQQAIDRAAYGDTILIREGFYRDTVKVHIRSELPGYVTIMNHREERVVIDGNNPEIGPLIKIGSDRIRLKGLVITHSATFGIYSSKTTDIYIEDCEVAYSQDGGIVFVDAAGICGTIAMCTIIITGDSERPMKGSACIMSIPSRCRAARCTTTGKKGLTPNMARKTGKFMTTSFTGTTVPISTLTRPASLIFTTMWCTVPWQKQVFP
jgi:hypothetical protein